MCLRFAVLFKAQPLIQFSRRVLPEGLQMHSTPFVFFQNLSYNSGSDTLSPVFRHNCDEFDKRISLFIIEEGENARIFALTLNISALLQFRNVYSINRPPTISFVIILALIILPVVPSVNTFWLPPQTPYKPHTHPQFLTESAPQNDTFHKADAQILFRDNIPHHLARNNLPSLRSIFGFVVSSPVSPHENRLEFARSVPRTMLSNRPGFDDSIPSLLPAPVQNTWQFLR